MTIYVQTSPNVCFCTTWENRTNETSDKYSLWAIYPVKRKRGSAITIQLNSLADGSSVGRYLSRYVYSLQLLTVILGFKI